MMDINMPVMDGLEASKAIFTLYEQVKAKPEHSHIPKPVIFAVTGNQKSEVKEAVEDSLIVQVLFKPVEKS